MPHVFVGRSSGPRPAPEDLGHATPAQLEVSPVKALRNLRDSLPAPNSPRRAFALRGRRRGRRAVGPVRHGVRRAGWAWATRNPRLLFRFSGAFLFRFADRPLRGLLFQLLPRIT